MLSVIGPCCRQGPCRACPQARMRARRPCRRICEVILADELHRPCRRCVNVADTCRIRPAASPAMDFEQLLLAAAGNARDAENLAGVCGKAHIVELLRCRQCVRTVRLLDRRCAASGFDRVGSVDIQSDRVADHHVRQFLSCSRPLVRIIADDTGPCGGRRRGRTAPQHLVELVGDDDDGLSVIAHVAHDSKELVRFLRGEDGGRLIENQICRRRGTAP